MFYYALSLFSVAVFVPLALHHGWTAANAVTPTLLITGQFIFYLSTLFRSREGSFWS